MKMPSSICAAILALTLLNSGTAAVGGYDEDVIIKDGPIIYGTGLSNNDRHEAWKHFFMLMFEAAMRQNAAQYGGYKNIPSTLLSVRCEEGICFRMIDAKLTGIGGSQTPRNVVLIIEVDAKDNNIQLSRTVCTFPSEDGGIKFCRDWGTGKLIGIDMKNPASGEWEKLK